MLMLIRYNRLGASSRLRSLQYLSWLEKSGIQVTVQALLSDKMLMLRYQLGRYSLWSMIRAYFIRLKTLFQCHHRFDLVWIEKEALQWFPLWIEATILRKIPYVLDYDDAVFHKYDQHENFLRYMYGQRLDGLMAKASLVTCGNSYLANRAHAAGCPWVEVLPTVIDLERYTMRQAIAKLVPLRIVWIGSPATVHYLQLLHEPLLTLAEHCLFVLRIIGGDSLNIPKNVQVETVPWKEDTEVDSISACDIGVMPLHDTPWERGKCGYKLIQYMACGLPIIASPVGVNCEIVEHGVNGFLANTSEEWIHALQSLINDYALRKRMGQAGRRKVEQHYSLQVIAPRLAALLKKVVGRVEEYK